MSALPVPRIWTQPAPTKRPLPGFATRLTYECPFCGMVVGVERETTNFIECPGCELIDLRREVQHLRYRLEVV